MGDVADGKVSYIFISSRYTFYHRKQEDFNKIGGVKGEAAESAIARLIDNQYLPGDPFPGSVKQ